MTQTVGFNSQHPRGRGAGSPPRHPDAEAALGPSAIRPAEPGPLIVTFASAGFLPMLEVWTTSLARLGVHRIRVYGLDEATRAWCASRGIESRALSWSGNLKALWQIRTGVFRQLLDDGEDFIHSDADAIWIRNPLEEGSARALADDLVFSQGTYWPPDVHDLQGFVLCCGWFRARPTEAARAFMRAVDEDGATLKNDQIAVNRILVAGGARWNRADADYTLAHGDRLIRCWNEPIHARLESTGLTVALLPHREFQRLPEPYDGVVVRHFLLPKACEDRVEALRRMGALPS